jgi:acyl-CoA reductase-like NAD-dependent aldehyde dehydrogenase
LYIGGRFVRSESNRSYAVYGHGGAWLANAVRASRKDLRDAVVAARASLAGWAGLTAYNRGQILYRIAEMMEGRRTDLAEEVGRAEGPNGVSQVDTAIDVWVFYAGLSDKLSQTFGGLNSVAGPYFNLTVPEPTGVTGIVAPSTPSFLGLSARLAPALCGGNTVVVIASEAHPLVALPLAECLATADVPGGVVNLLTGRASELVPVLSSHGDVDALDVGGVVLQDLAAVEESAARNVKRVVRAGGAGWSPYEALGFMEYKTVWHPKGP